MRYFNQVLSSILLEETLHDEALFRAMRELVEKAIKIEKSKLGDADKERQLQRIQGRLKALRQDDNAEQFDEFSRKFLRNNEDYKKSAKRTARTEPLLLWALQHLHSKATSNT